MPKIAFYKYLWFYIVSYDLNERLHIHISNTRGRKSRDAKLWLDTAEIFSKGDLTPQELNLCRKLVAANRDNITTFIINFAKGKRQKPFQLKLK